MTGADLGGGGHQAWAPLFLLLEFYICPNDNTYSSYIDLTCLLYVYVTVKYNLTIVVLTSTRHTHPLLGRYARSCVWAPLFRNSGSAPA